MTPSQSSLLEGMQSVPELNAAQSLPDSDLILQSILSQMERVPPSAIEYLQERPPFGITVPTPGLVQSAVSAGSTGGGLSINGHEFTNTYLQGVAGLRSIEAMLGSSPLEIARMTPEELSRMEAHLKAYAHSVEAIYAEGISYGWTPSHLMAHIEHLVYELKRRVKAGEVSHDSKLSLATINVGFNMKHLNKLDPSGRLGDLVLEKKREFLAQYFGPQKTCDSQSEIRGGRAIAPVNGGIITGTTTSFTGDVANGFTERHVRETLARVQRELQEYISSPEFNGQLRTLLGDKTDHVLKKIKGYKVQLSSTYQKVEFSARDAKHGALETKIMRHFGAVKYGQNLAEREMEARPDAETHLHTRSVENTREAIRASHTIYGIHRSSAPERGGRPWSQAELVNNPDRPIVITEADIREGRILRLEHTFGILKRNLKEVTDQFDKLKQAVEKYMNVSQQRPTEISAAVSEVGAASWILRQYLTKPPEEIDPSGRSVLGSLGDSFARARRVFRFRTADGEGFLAYKRDHMGEVINEGAAREGVETIVLGGDELITALTTKDGHRFIMYGEGHKLSDFMKKYAELFGSEDAALAHLFHLINQDFEVKLKDNPSRTDFKKIMEGVFADINYAFENLPYHYSMKTSLPGGKWNGIQFGVTPERRLFFRRPKDEQEKEFAKKVDELQSDAEFRDVVSRNFANVMFRADFKEGILTETEFDNTNGGVAKRDVWHFRGDSGDTNGRELYLEKGTECKSAKGNAYRPETTFKLQMVAVPLEDARDLPFIINEIAPEAVQQMKQEGRDVIFIPKLTGYQKARGRAEWRFLMGGRDFSIAHYGSRGIINLIHYMYSGDPDDLSTGMNPASVAKTYGAMSAGSFAGEYSGRVFIEGVSGNLFPRTPSGVRRLNPQALRIQYRGGRAFFVRNSAMVGAVAVTDLVQHGRVDPISLANSLALMKGAKHITQAMLAYNRIKALKVTKLHPVKLLVEFLVMEGLGAIEAEAVVAYEMYKRRSRLESAMRECDGAVEDMRRSGVSRMDFYSPEAIRLEQAHLEVIIAYRHCSELEKFSSKEFERVQRAYKDLVKQNERVAKLRETYPDDLDKDTFIKNRTEYYEKTEKTRVESHNYNEDWSLTTRQRAQKEWTTIVSANVELEEKRMAYGRSIEEAETQFQRNVAARARGNISQPKISAGDLHIPFEVERDVRLEERRQYLEAVRQVSVPMDLREARYASHTTTYVPQRLNWDARYKLPDNWHEALLKFNLFLEERRQYLLDGDVPRAVLPRMPES